MIKQSAPGSIIIHFLGGIHEIYFPYVLMNPVLVLAVIAGGASGVLTFGIFGAGLYATPSPGSIFMLLAMAAKGAHLGVIAGVIVSTAVSFLVASYFVKRASSKETDEDLDTAKEKVKELKGTVVKKQVNKIVFACDAGMGSSAMGASILKNKLKKAGLDIAVVNAAIEDIPADADVVVTHENLTARAKSARPNAEHISIKDFVNSPEYDNLVNRLA
jgi:PTS system mannitol-specific IIC component